MEPPIVGYRFTTEAEEEFAEWVVRKGKPCIKKDEVGMVVLPGPVEGLPNGHHVGVKVRIAFPARGEIPQESVATGVDADTSANNLILILGYKDACPLAVVQLEKQSLGRNEPADFKAIEVVEQPMERFYFLLRLGFACHYAEGVDMLYALQGLGIDTFGW